MGDPLPRLAGPADRLHEILLASGAGPFGLGPRMGRWTYPPRPPPRPSLGESIRRRRPVPDRVVRPGWERGEPARFDPDRPGPPEQAAPRRRRFFDPDPCHRHRL